MNAQRFHVSGSGHPTRVTPEQAVALWSDRLQPQPLHEVLDCCDHLCFGRILSTACGKQEEILRQRRTQMRKQLGQVISSTARHLPHPAADVPPPTTSSPLTPSRLSWTQSSLNVMTFHVQVEVQMACRGRCHPHLRSMKNEATRQHRLAIERPLFHDL